MNYLNTDELRKRLEALREDDEPYDKAELIELEAMESGISDWEHSEHLIPESDFKAYAQELAKDIGAVGASAGWPLSYIDWDAATDALKMDYTEFGYLGVTYLVRA